MKSSAWNVEALLVAPALEVRRSVMLSHAEIVLVFGRFSSNVALVVMSCALVNKFVAPL